MAANGESIWGTRPALEPWQFYGPTTKKDGTLYLHLLMRPYGSIDVRGVPVRRVKAVRELRSGQPLQFRTRTSLIDGLMPDPDGTLTIKVPDELLDDNATVIAVEVDGL
jgi:alpha-L-fucosidase